REGRPAVLCCSSEETLCARSPFYQSGEAPLVSGQLGYTFFYCRTPGVKPVYSGDFTIDDALLYGFSGSFPAVLPENVSFTGRNIKKLVCGKAGRVKITAQGLFDFGGEYRAAKSGTHAKYMQNAALISQSLCEMSDTYPRSKYIPPVSNYLDPHNDSSLETGPSSLSGSSSFSGSSYEASGDGAGYEASDPCEKPMRLVTDKLRMSGELREGRGIYAVADLGEETFGYFSMKVSVKRPAVIGIGYSDHLDDLRARSYVGGRNFAATVIVPEGETSFTHLFSKIGARYVQIYAECDDITINSLGIVPVFYPLDEGHAGIFETNDALHEAIYETSLRTLRLCMNEHYMDCPQREQALYAMDSRNQMLCGYYAFGEYEYAKESLRLMGRSLRSDGLLELCSPAKCSVTIPSFSIHWIIALCEYTKFSGDTAFFAEWLNVANTIMRAMLSNRTQNGCLKRWDGNAEWWNFHEWSGELSGSLGIPSEGGADACLTALFIIATDMLSKLLAEVAPENGNAREQAAMLQELIKEMRAAFNKTFFDDDLKIYASFNSDGVLSDHSEYTNSLAILSGAASLSAETLRGALKAVSGSRELPTEVLPCTLSTSIFKYDALMSVSPSNITLVMKDIEKNWGKMLFCGATSFWETIAGADDFDDAGSLCHGWSAVPVIVYYKYILGIRPVRCGFREYAIDVCGWNGHVSRGRVYLPATDELLTVETDGRTYSGNTAKA
ncbi:MAG: hypothetical protein IKX06_05250, partial [Clostridia bacterium]|nr:hypothetical protein [Clostridia bacterium]